MIVLEQRDILNRGDGEMKDRYLENQLARHQ